MSAETASAEPAGAARRKALRIALAVSVGFTASVVSGEVIPFLGPLLAAQFLIAGSRPLSLRQAIGLVVIVLVCGTALEGLSIVMGDKPPVLLLLLGLVYFICFHLQARGKGGPSVFLIMIISVMVPMMTVLNRDLGESVLSILFYGVSGGILLSWGAHLIFPEPGSDEAAAASPAVHPLAVRRAIADTAILLLIVCVCFINDALSTAVVIPITVVSLLMQLDFAGSARAALGLMLVNLFGGLVACLAFSFVELRPTVFSLFVVTLLSSLILGGRAALPRGQSKFFAGALTTFLLIFGTAVSPLPGTAGETFATRIGYVVLAIVYTMVMAALFWPKIGLRPERQAPETPMSSTA